MVGVLLHYLMTIYRGPSVSSVTACVFFLFYPLEPTIEHEIVFHLGQSNQVPLISREPALENLTFWWRSANVHQEVWQKRSRERWRRWDGERACCWAQGKVSLEQTFDAMRRAAQVCADHFRKFK